MSEPLKNICILTLDDMKISVPQEDILTVGQMTAVNFNESSDCEVGYFEFDHHAFQVYRLSSSFSKMAYSGRDSITTGDFLVAFNGSDDDRCFALACHKVESIVVSKKETAIQTIDNFMCLPSMPMSGLFHHDNSIIYSTNAMTLSTYISETLGGVANHA